MWQPLGCWSLEVCRITYFCALMNTKSPFIYILVALVLGVMFSCDKPENGDPFITTPQFSKLLFVNVLSEEAQFDVAFYIDQINYTPNSVGFGNVSESYVSITGRTHDFAVKHGDDFILQENIKITEGKHYTLFLTGTRAFPVFALIEDDFTMEPNTAACSFVNMAPKLDKVKLENHYPIDPYYGWIDTDTLIVKYLHADPIGTPFYKGSRQFYGENAEQLADILVRVSNLKGDIPYTNNTEVRMPLEVNKFGALVFYPDTSETLGYNILSYSKTDKL